jgi:hypothetical protein
MQMNFFSRTKNRRTRLIVVTPDLSGERDHTTHVPLKKFICLIVSVALLVRLDGHDQSAPVVGVDYQI